MKMSRQPELDHHVLTALKIVIKNGNHIWHWLCKEHPQVALEYQALVEREERGFSLEKPADDGTVLIDNLERGHDGPRERNRLAVFRQLVTHGLKRYNLNDSTHQVHDYVRKSDLLDAYPKSKAQAYKHFESVERHFQTLKLGAYVYVRLKEAVA